jgi:hypothetical protein
VEFLEHVLLEICNAKEMQAQNTNVQANKSSLEKKSPCAYLSWCNKRVCVGKLRCGPTQHVRSADLSHDIGIILLGTNLNCLLGLGSSNKLLHDIAVLAGTKTVTKTCTCISHQHFPFVMPE